MHISVTTHAGKTILFHVEASDTIDSVKAQTKDREIIPPHHQWLICTDKTPEDGWTLSAYDLQYSHEWTPGGVPCERLKCVHAVRGMQLFVMSFSSQVFYCPVS